MLRVFVWCGLICCACQFDVAGVLMFVDVCVACAYCFVVWLLGCVVVRVFVRGPSNI